jgi:long-subunit fatty acid transport protein
MDKKGYALFITLLFLYSISVKAQNETDVVRYLDNSPLGTARTSSMAGSFGALGGDLTTPLINPAGSAIYRKNELSFTPGLSFNSVLSNSQEKESENNLTKIHLSNFGFASSSLNEENKDLYFNYSMGYSKSIDIKRENEIGFLNNNSSMLFSFTKQARGINVNNLSDEVPFTSYLAYENYLIDEHPDEQVTYTTQPQYELNFNGVYQLNKIEESGSMGDFFINLSAAIMEKVYVGATVSFINGNYDRKTLLRERTTVDTLLLDEFSFIYDQNTSLSALGIKLGFIVKPEKWLRVGLAWHIPYKLSITDRFSTRLNSTWKDGDYFDISSPDGSISYKLRNPGKWIFSAAFITGFRGLINLDVEWLNYSASEISSSEFSFNEENALINQRLRSVFTVKVGGEIWFGRYNFRAGYAFKQNPYVDPGIMGKSYYTTLSAGLGFVSDENLFVNLSVNYTEDGSNYYPYSESISPVIYDSFTTYRVLVSVGKRF